MVIDAGLCASCAHRREIRSDRDAVFTQCTLALTDPSFEKYPRLPVFRCGGYEPSRHTQPEPR